LADHDEIGHGGAGLDLAPSGPLDLTGVLKASKVVDETGDQDRRQRFSRSKAGGSEGGRPPHATAARLDHCVFGLGVG
jgi:hypothetical protein